MMSETPFWSPGTMSVASVEYATHRPSELIDGDTLVSLPRLPASSALVEEMAPAWRSKT